MSTFAMHLPGRSSMRAGRILVAGSRPRLREDVRTALEFEGHQVAETETADRTLEETCSGQYQVLIVTSGREDIEPHELCRAIRMKSDLGIIVLGGRDDTRQGRIDALNAGADDYVSCHRLSCGNYWRGCEPCCGAWPGLTRKDVQLSFTIVPSI